MAPRDDSDWSDSDDEELSEMETSVLLGVPDGPIEKQEDAEDVAVSRIGGYPAFLPSNEPSLSSAQCKNCSFPMELLVQLWCPFEESTMDRALYIFGCARGSCQHKSGSIRTYRGLRFNAAYTEKLTKKKARQAEKEAAKAKAKEEEGRKKEAAKVNPFSMSSAAEGTASGLFGAAPEFGATSGIGSKLFCAKSDDDDLEEEDAGDDATEPPPSEQASEDENEDPDEDDEDDTGSSSSILQAPASTTSASSPWRSVPSYSPVMYLSTASEYLPPPSKFKLKLETDDGLGPEKEGKSKKAGKKGDEVDSKEANDWNAAMEGYENSLEVDHVFERFAKRVGYEGEQCIRYELGGTPLPYAHNAIFTSLFPSPTSEIQTTLVTQQQSKVTLPTGKRVYDPSSKIISPCPRCGGKRVFECQLMPHLINVLQNECTSSFEGGKKDKWEGKSEEERKKEVERILKGSKATEGAEGRGMEWGTALVFSCEKDCCLAKEGGKEEAKECWAEELVLVQWEE